ncbi:ANM_collapsed_G0035550.mRNA.1.CDS.1 [Saccharomyces cerevisiae]|nr:ANM_collapsed_G0035550.mRNA.1.CDS.1 [Saccharomyces cerevisiae]
MLESLAANLLNRLLGSYVENFDPNQLNVGIWSGDVKLKKLKTKKRLFGLIKFTHRCEIRDTG